MAPGQYNELDVALIGAFRCAHPSCPFEHTKNKPVTYKTIAQTLVDTHGTACYSPILPKTANALGLKYNKARKKGIYPTLPDGSCGCLERVISTRKHLIDRHNVKMADLSGFLRDEAATSEAVSALGGEVVTTAVTTAPSTRRRRKSQITKIKEEETSEGTEIEDNGEEELVTKRAKI